MIHDIKIELHSSSDIKYFVESHLCKLCDTPIAYIIHTRFKGKSYYRCALKKALEFLDEDEE